MKLSLRVEPCVAEAWRWLRGAVDVYAGLWCVLRWLDWMYSVDWGLGNSLYERGVRMLREWCGSRDAGASPRRLTLESVRFSGLRSLLNNVAVYCCGADRASALAAAVGLMLDPEWFPAHCEDASTVVSVYPGRGGAALPKLVAGRLAPRALLVSGPRWAVLLRDEEPVARSLGEALRLYEWGAPRARLQGVDAWTVLRETPGSREADEHTVEYPMEPHTLLAYAETVLARLEKGARLPPAEIERAARAAKRAAALTAGPMAAHAAELYAKLATTLHTRSPA